jgi:hypothetical protein
MASPSISLSTPAMILSKRGLARAIEAQHADLGAREKAQGNVFQDLALGRHVLLTRFMEKTYWAIAFSNLQKWAEILRTNRDYRPMRQYTPLWAPVARHISNLLGTKEGHLPGSHL